MREQKTRIFSFRKLQNSSLNKVEVCIFFLLQNHAIYCCQSSSHIIRHLGPFVHLFYHLHMWLAYPGPSWLFQLHPSCLHSSRKEERKGEGNGPFLKKYFLEVAHITSIFIFLARSQSHSHIATREAEEMFSLSSVATCYWSLFIEKNRKVDVGR